MYLDYRNPRVYSHFTYPQRRDTKDKLNLLFSVERSDTNQEYTRLAEKSRIKITIDFFFDLCYRLSMDALFKVGETVKVIEGLGQLENGFGVVIVRITNDFHGEGKFGYYVKLVNDKRLLGPYYEYRFAKWLPMTIWSTE